MKYKKATPKKNETSKCSLIELLPINNTIEHIIKHFNFILIVFSLKKDG